MRVFFRLTRALCTRAPTTITLPSGNVTENVLSKMNWGLHRLKDHPLSVVRQRMVAHFLQTYKDASGAPLFKSFESLDPVVSVQHCYDDLLTPADHVSRSWNDTYYVDKDRVLRPHMTAHQTQLLREGHRAFLYSGDVFRRDTVDATHSPVFHQMDGVRVFSRSELPADDAQAVQYVLDDLKQALEGAIRAVFGNVECRWVEADFPFTTPSLELEIFFNNNWLEVLGCGVTQRQILRNCKLETELAWAFGVGLERLAMVLFDIGDIRLFWSKDARFLSQFAGLSDDAVRVVKFKAFSKFPACYHDISFWCPDDFHDNSFFELVRATAGEMAENVEIIDEFCHPKTKRTSKCFRVTYRSMERNLTNEEVLVIHAQLRERTVAELRGELRQ